MNKKKLLSLLLTLLTSHSIIAQNITDLAVKGNERQTVALDLSDSCSVTREAFLCPDRIRFDSRCFQIDGEDVFLYTGTMHYFRVAKSLWRDRLQKLKAAGLNGVETYVPWNWHERQMPQSPADFSKVDMSDLADFLTLADSLRLYVILRPGPYICAEWSGGGFPQWLTRKRPRKTKRDVWLQSDDPEFELWSRHWLQAVCRVAVPHQITRRKPHTGGVILFQIENEYNRVTWFPHEAKRNYLESLARDARALGIDVPLITCWTSEARNVKDGPLGGVLDMVNSYPKWQVEKRFGGQINPQLKTQPGKPLASAELQGGWCCELGWPLFWQQDGLAPVQTQNVTLYALQRGFSAINYYMMVGGTNFDDWASRNQITSYDYAAAIGEDGTVNERYHRIRAMASLIKEHGPCIPRAHLMPVEYQCGDSLVEVALRQADNDDRYFFVRTEDRTKDHQGRIRLQDGIAFDFRLEPFGSKVYYLPAGAKEGVWYPQTMDAADNPATPGPLHLKLTWDERQGDPVPTKWSKLHTGQAIDDQGTYGHHYVYYRLRACSGRSLTIYRPGKNTENASAADSIVVVANGHSVPLIAADKETAVYRLPGDSASGRKISVVMLYESQGLHHHVNSNVERWWHNGPSVVCQDGVALPLEYADVERLRGLSLSEGGRLKKKKEVVPLMYWGTSHFFLNDTSRPVWITFPHQANGFVYVNGHCIGRCWTQGPQREYYIPECWLKTGTNLVAVSQRGKIITERNQE